ncbi:PR domain zinc finger protein 15-like [Sabethes cyaneus]|uniref:PR domain zinc finger protein 15-like n=1 Tax=Sabethes cyaneus TaxID=53552 RepID=UPI00237EAC21|nr:PR domain zinc finger protein 15-like [Sabethes cyaneus]
MNTCRLCLKDFLLLQKNYNVHSLRDKLQLVFSFEITKDNRFAEVICPACVLTISQFYQYACQVQQNQLKLYKTVEESMQEKKTSEQVATTIADVSTEFADVASASQKTCPLKITTKTKIPATFDKNLVNRYLNMVCDICKKDLITYQKLEVHFKKFHGKRCYVSCCEQKLTSNQMISDHLKKHISWTQKKDTTSWQQRVLFAFSSILTDFKRDLEGYEPLPNMELALKGDHFEKQKLHDVQDHLVQIYFCLNCELCRAKLDNQDDRRFHFRQSHPDEKYYISCCEQRFSTRISIMRHLNRHWKRAKKSDVTEKQSVITEYEVSSTIEMSQSSNLEWQSDLHSNYDPLINEFREELVAGGFDPPHTLPENETEEEQVLLRKMQDFLIAKHSSLNCELCEIQIFTYMERQEHFRLSHPEKLFFVNCCGSKLAQRCEIVLHIMRHKKGLPVKSVNSIRHVPAQMFEKHEQEDVIIESYYKMDCELCDYTGNSYLGLRLHFGENHRDEGFFITCCNRRFRAKCHILEHIAKHEKPQGVKCEQCEATFAVERMLKAHIIRKHVKEEEKLYRCDQCVASFATKALLSLHSYKHEMVTCDICGMEMKRCSIRVHKINVHKLGEEIVCDVCAKVYHSQHMFNKHYRTSHLGIRKKYKRKSRAKKRLPAADEQMEMTDTTHSCDLSSLEVL